MVMTKHTITHFDSGEILEIDNDLIIYVILNDNGDIHSTEKPALHWRNSAGEMLYTFALFGQACKLDEWCEVTDKTEKEKALILLKYQGNLCEQ